PTSAIRCTSLTPTYRHTVPSAPNADAPKSTRLNSTQENRSYATCRSASHANTVTNPAPSEPNAVTFNTTPDAPSGTPPRPATSTPAPSPAAARPPPACSPPTVDSPVLLSTRRAPTSTLFPYATLSRSPTSAIRCTSLTPTYRHTVPSAPNA